jgi:CBS domain-containing protein
LPGCERIPIVEAGEIEAFLARLPLCGEVPRRDLEAAARESRTKVFKQGTVVLTEDGPPSSYLYVIRSGSMELLSGEKVFAILEPGEAFGHLSLLTRMPPTATVRVGEEAICYLVPPEAARLILARPSGAALVSATLRERLGRRGHSVRALPEVRRFAAGVSVGTPPVSCRPETTIREAAQVMTDGRCTAIVVRTRDGLGIATDADLRARVATGQISVDDRISAVMTFPARTVPRAELGAEALVSALLDPVDHVIVLDQAGEAVGVLPAAQLLSLQSTTPFALRQMLLRARDEEELAEAAQELDDVFLSLLAANLSCADIGRVLTFLVDAATVRLLDLAFQRHGPPQASWAWLAFGSAARREFTLTSDQDNALAYDDEGGEPAELYFQGVAVDVNAGLVRCGFKRDGADVLASDKRWRMSKGEWVRELRACLEAPDRSHLVRAAISVDFRHLAGELELVSSLHEILATAAGYPDFLRRVARTATDCRPSLSFRGAFVVERRGEAAGRLDIKAAGMRPITNLARFHALEGGGTAVATLERLDRAEEHGELRAQTARSLRDAFDVAWRVRLEHQAARREAGVVADDLIDPEQLPPVAREELREAFRTIRAAQNKLDRFLPSRR